MKRNLLLSTIFIALISGCGGGDNRSPDRDRDNTIQNNSIRNSQSYNLWEYFTPNRSKTNSYKLYENNSVSSYKTSYNVSNNKVIEVDDYAPNEKTIYEKRDNYIEVKFQKDGKPNGIYKLKLYANIGDSVTVLDSTCKLTKHYDNFTIKDQAFNDVIEIRCGNKPGYYQKGVGEIAQDIKTNNQKVTRVLSN